MLASLCLILSLAILHSTILHSVVTSDSNNNTKSSKSEDTLRMKRNTEISENIVKSKEETRLVLVKWFKSVLDGDLVLKTDPNVEGTQHQDKNNVKPTKTS